MEKIKVEIIKGKTVTLDELFKMKKKFHTELSKLPFEEKIAILIKMWELVRLKGQNGRGNKHFE